MKYTIDDIPYLIGLHFRLTRDGERSWNYLIHSCEDDGHVYVDWPNRIKGTGMARYGPVSFLRNLNDGTWMITDLPTVDISSVIKEEINKSGINKYKVGDKFYPIKSLYMNGEVNDPSRRFVTEGKIYEIVKIDRNYDWAEYGYRGNRYILLTDNTTRENAGHGFSDRYIDKNFIKITGDNLLDIDDTFNKLYEQESDDFGWAKDIISSMPDLPKPNHYVTIIFLRPNQSEDSIYNLLTHLDLLGWNWKTNDYRDYERVLSNITKNEMYDEPYIVLQRNGMLSYGTNLESFEETFGIHPENCKTYSYPTSVIKEQEDDLEWAKDLFKSTEIPDPKNTRLAVVILNGTYTYEDLKHIMDMLYEKGWHWSGPRYGTIPNILKNISNNVKDVYIKLHARGQMSHGYGEEMFSRHNGGYRFQDAPQFHF
jgi:hypothetical protein